MAALTFALAVFIYFGRFSAGLSTVNFKMFCRNGAYDGLTCPVFEAIFSTENIVSDEQCVLLCSKESACVGVFYQAQTKQCFACSSFTKDEAPPHDGTRFYGRVYTDCYIYSAWSYQGKTNKTISGRTCQRWDSQDPHTHPYNSSEGFHDTTLQEVNNYCKDPPPPMYYIYKNTPWCYTMDVNKTWEYCDITKCE